MSLTSQFYELLGIFILIKKHFIVVDTSSCKMVVLEFIYFD